MRIAHLTDIHVHVKPRLGELTPKRLIGSTNLYLFGRQRKFDPVIQSALVEAALATTPDAAIITGDLTAQGLPGEFETAKDLLQPLLDAVPTSVIPGNHDVYVRERSPGAVMRATFGPWMDGGLPYLRRVGEVGFLGLETCRAHPLSSGRTPPEQLDQATALLEDSDARFVFLLCIHYPLRGRDGHPYGPRTRALSNAARVEAWLAGTDRVHAVLHGHEHHGFRTQVPSLAGPIPILNPGSSGYARDPERGRTAHFNVYVVEHGELVDVERYTWNGQTFVPEPGGAYATGG